MKPSRGVRESRKAASFMPEQQSHTSAARRAPKRFHGRRALLVGALAATLTATLLLVACTRAAHPTRVSREALGTVVTLTVYAGRSATVAKPVDDAFEAIARAERVLSAYPDEAADEGHAARPQSLEVTSVVGFNLYPFEWHLLPPEATAVLERIKTLGVGPYFSPALLRVMGLYDFDGPGAVPDETELARLVRASKGFETRATSEGLEAHFAKMGILTAPSHPAFSSYVVPAVGLDLSGAAKGAALDAAVAALQSAAGPGAITGALVTAGSTTLVMGSKPAGSEDRTWNVGIEDPRDPQKIIGIVHFTLGDAAGTAAGALPIGTVSTSGDYQQSFVRDGVRYHHILDPATGKPARETRTLTVVGAVNGLDSDILSTALFVMGTERAETYAREHGLGLFMVDAEGRTRIVPGPKDAPWTISEGAR